MCNWCTDYKNCTCNNSLNLNKNYFKIKIHPIICTKDNYLLTIYNQITDKNELLTINYIAKNVNENELFNNIGLNKTINYSIIKICIEQCNKLFNQLFNTELYTDLNEQHYDMLYNNMLTNDPYEIDIFLFPPNVNLNKINLSQLNNNFNFTYVKSLLKEISEYKDEYSNLEYFYKHNNQFSKLPYTINFNNDSCNILNVKFNEPLEIVAGFIYNNNNQILIQKRSNGLWEFPGGKIEPNELKEEAISREIKEELGFITSKKSFIYCTDNIVNSNKSLFNYHITYFKLINNLFDKNNGIGIEGQEYKFIDLSDLYQYEFMDSDKQVINDYLSKNINLYTIEQQNKQERNNVKMSNEINNQKGNNMMETMFNGNGLFSKIDVGLCKFTMSGKIAVKTATGYKSYNVETGKLTNCNNFCMPFGDNMFFIMPATKVKAGDIIIVDNKPLCVINYEKNKCQVMNYEDNSIETIVPERHFMFGNMYLFRKVTSFFGKMFGNGIKGFGSGMMKFMMMQQMFNNQNNNQNNNMFGNFDMNTLMMMQMMKSNNFENMFDFDDCAEDMFNFDEETTTDNTVIDAEPVDTEKHQA